jgi:RNA polymerase sigma factor (sigma-70 family)
MTNDKQQLIEDNIKLVHYIISREYPTYAFDEDIAQCGMVGLCRAANSWQGLGLFSTYAGKCIRHAIRQEFIFRKRYAKTVSLDHEIGDELTVGDTLVGDEDVVYMDEAFYGELTADELMVLKLNSKGFSTDDIAKRSGFNVQKVQKLLRLIQLKWKKFCHK